MSKADNLHDFLQDVSDAIKEKKGSTEPINAQSFSEEIRNLPSGGEVAVFDKNMEDKTGYGFTEIESCVVADGVIGINYRAYFGCQSLKHISLPNTITNFGIQCFQDCILLTSLVLPSNMSRIQNMVFYGCKALELLDCRNSTQIPSLGSAVFVSGNANLRIVVPDALYDEWIAATNWAAMAGQIIKASEYESQN